MRLPLLVLIVTTMAIAQDGPPAGRAPLKVRAAQGDAEAQFTLAKNYEAGRGGLTKDYEQAHHWYLLSANQGDPWAQASLGLLYRFGKGVPKDPVQAYMWFTLSIAGTKGPDADSIVELRDAVVAHMSKEEIAEATRLAHAWKPTPVVQP
ncbi:tetratricopeptide repeat protein [uncultured Paludibaculum sp.]|uniref:tetratricopeptide repeat protein n=1 Tax=uncultured Paludibaculum sp. TaxID=1765020 RepID=UPI002AABA285|nr:tetratricopeptide repeat protein [uncultured Paludibaculum sp.]